MKKIFYVIILCFAFQFLAAQSTYTTDENGKITYTQVEVRPEFPGGINEFYKFVAKNFRYPKEKVVGRVIAQFVVDEQGALTDLKIIRDLGYGTGDEAIRVLSKCPKWIPGKQDGKAVRVLYSLPISLRN